MTGEEVLVVPREALNPFIGDVKFDLITTNTGEILQLIEDEHVFIPRDLAETSPEFKQIIPYVIIRYSNDYYVLRRTKKQAEKRLHDKLSLGIGGHINPDAPTVLAGLKKELDEEVAVESKYSLTFAGILNDDTTDVGRVHLGAVFVLEAERRNVTVRETDKMTGEWIPGDRLATMRSAMETWSQIVYDRLIVQR